jgi:hypothetical protein
MKKLTNLWFVLMLAAFLVQCEVVSEDLLQDPNAPSEESASPDFLLNSIQIETENFFSAISDHGSEVTRMLVMFGSTYDNAYTPQSFNFEWEKAYADILIDANTLIPLATERELFIHSGIARVLRAYTLVTLVDHFGDVPLTEALDEANFNPASTAGSDVYAAALVQLDSARINLNQETAFGPSDDLYYDGDAESWIRLANTLELKILYQQRLVAENTARINELLAGNLVDEPGEAFVFPYSTTSSNPDSRHPNFSAHYLNGAAEYMSNYYMNELWQDKSVRDPRLRYYFYRQVNVNTTDVNEQDCVNNRPPNHYRGNGNGVSNNDPFCEDWNDVGYWGRDHGNDDGIPPDNLLRSTFGVYPAGGRFDADQAEGVSADFGLQGAGIQPIWMPFFTDFVRAEVELAINSNPAAARTALENGVRNSISYVQNFATGNNPSGADAVAAEDGDFTPTQAAIDTYVSEVLARYDGGDNSAKLSILAKEYYLALWGNGIEAYNLYRRIAPARDNPNWNMQPNISSSPGTFTRSMKYPAAYIERNSNAASKDISTKVFWDNNPDGFADF